MMVKDKNDWDDNENDHHQQHKIGLVVNIYEN